MRKLSLEIVISDGVEKILLDHGIDEKDTNEYLRALLGKGVQQILDSLPEMMLALKSGLASEQEIMEKMYQKGANAGSELRRQYDEKKKDKDEKS